MEEEEEEPLLYGLRIDLPDNIENKSSYEAKLGRFLAALQDFDHFSVLMRDVKRDLNNGDDEMIRVTVDAIKKILSERQ